MNFEVFVDWYQGLPPYLRAYWTIAIAMSIVFAIQMTLTLIGLGDTDSAGDIGDMDAGGADLGVGWGGVCLSGVIENRFLLAVAAFVCGCIMVCAFILMYKQLMKLEGNGSYRIEESVGQVCEVYLRIPGSRSGSGKVQVSFHGSVQELPAQTEGDAIPSGTKVKVAKVVDKSLLIVERL